MGEGVEADRSSLPETSSRSAKTVGLGAAGKEAEGETQKAMEECADTVTWQGSRTQNCSRERCGGASVRR